MAEKVTVELVDDIDGSVAAETVEFHLDGSSFRIDLSSRNAMKLREHLAMFISASRPPTATEAGGPSNSRSTSTEERRRSQQIREWARQEGLSISERGRIPHDLILRFEAAAEGRRAS